MVAVVETLDGGLKRRVSSRRDKRRAGRAEERGLVFYSPQGVSCTTTPPANRINSQRQQKNHLRKKSGASTRAQISRRGTDGDGAKASHGRVWRTWLLGSSPPRGFSWPQPGTKGPRSTR